MAVIDADAHVIEWERTWGYMDETERTFAPIYMAARAPHPHAAALLADFLISKRGQDIMHGRGRWMGHKSIGGKGPDDIGERRMVVPSAEKWGDRYNELVGWYNKLLLRK